jgi:hypothetical protein
MSKVAIVEGVRIDFYPSEHAPPHFHAVFAEYRAQIDIRRLIVLRGSLPPAKLRLVLDWAGRHQDQLLAAWAAVEGKRKPSKIG